MNVSMVKQLKLVANDYCRENSKNKKLKIFKLEVEWLYTTMFIWIWNKNSEPRRILLKSQHFIQTEIEHLGSCQLLGHLIFLYGKFNLTKIKFLVKCPRTVIQEIIDWKTFFLWLILLRNLYAWNELVNRFFLTSKANINKISHTKARTTNQ